MKKSFVLILLLALVLASSGPARAQGSPCLINPGSTYCAGYVTFSSYYLSVPFKPFQSDFGTSVQRNITVNFSPWAKAIRVWANDPDATAKLDVYIYGFGYVGAFSITGDGQPGVFSVNGLGLGPGDWEITRIVLRPDPSDYVNWRVEFQKNSTSNPNSWCKITSSSYSCDGATATTSPFYQGTVFDAFQAVNNGTGEQAPIEITFGFPLYSVSATAVDPDYGGSRIEAYGSDGSLLGTTYFDGDNRPGFTTTSTKSVTDSRGIAKVILVPAAGDYVVFQGVTGTPF
jgi:hypothetical protein